MLKDLTQQILDGNRSIIGAMLESNIHHGNQSIPADLGELKYGVSVTDACMDWEMTENALMEMADSLRPVLFDRAKKKGPGGP